MKVILLRDVAKIGKKYSVVEVPDGFALNKLIPKKDAEPATPVALKRIAERQKAQSSILVAQGENLAVLEKASHEQPFTIGMEANEQGHLFQGVHAKDVVDSVKARGFDLDEEAVHITSPIKSLGRHEVKVAAKKNSVTIMIEVVGKGL